MVSMLSVLIVPLSFCALFNKVGTPVYNFYAVLTYNLFEGLHLFAEVTN